MNGICVTRRVLCLKRSDNSSVSTTWLSHLNPITAWIRLHMVGKLVGRKKRFQTGIRLLKILQRTKYRLLLLG